MHRSPTDIGGALERGKRARATRAGGMIAILVLLSGASRAVAQPTPDGGGAESADEMITRGVDLRRHGDDPAALPVLRSAYLRGTTPRAAAQLGFVEQALGLWLDAESHLGEAAAATTDPWVGEHASLLEESLAFVRRYIGALVIESNRADAELTVDGRSVGRTPLSAPLRIAAGDRRIEARSPGHQPFVAVVTIRGGRTTRVVALLDAATVTTVAAAPTTTLPALAPARAGASAGTGAPAPPEQPLYKKWWLWTGVAAVLVGVGVALAATNGGADPFPCGGNGRVCAQ